MKCEILDSLYKDDIDLNMFEVDENQGFKDNIVEYICGFVVKKIKQKTNCESCIKSLFGDRKDGLISVRQMDEKARLVYPSNFVLKIVKFAENVVNLELKKDDWLKKYYFDHCNIKICNGFVSFYGDIFKKMDNHSYELMKTIVSCYLSIRFKSYARFINEKHKKQNLRSKLMKIVLQNHQ